MIDFDFVLMERRQLAFDGSAALCTCRFQADQGCVPVCFDGESLRKQKASENLRFYRELLGENAGCA